MKKALCKAAYTVTGTVAGSKERNDRQDDGHRSGSKPRQLLPGQHDRSMGAREGIAGPDARGQSIVLCLRTTRIQHMDLIDSAQMALEDNKIDAAGRLFKQLANSPRTTGKLKPASRSWKRLQKGTLTRDILQKQFDKRQVDQVKVGATARPAGSR